MSTLFPEEDSDPLTISELTQQVKVLLEDTFWDGVHVTGEVSNLARPSSGHVYLKLKDANSQLNTVIYRGVALRLRYDLENGMEVIAQGKMSVYQPRGEYQLQVTNIEPKGIGALELAFRQLKERLSSKGYFLPERKRPIPAYPQKVGIITSPTGAAIRDVLEVLRRRWPALEVLVCPVSVQGEGSAEQIASAIHLVNQLSDAPDVLFIGRGGGSLEDLWAFNEEVVADAVCRSKIPVVTGIGHETDLTIADLVADVRALTPSEAAERIAPNRERHFAALQACFERMTLQMTQKIRQNQQRLRELAQRRSFRNPWSLIGERSQRVDDLQQRLIRAMRIRLENARQQVHVKLAQLESLSPLKVLQRGYSLTRMESDATILRRPEQAQPGERIITLLPTGRVISRVEEVRADRGEETRSPKDHL